MSHETETFLRDAPRGIQPYQVQAQCDGSQVKTLGIFNPSRADGNFSYWSRAASTKNPMSGSGWRDPAPYWAEKTMGASWATHGFGFYAKTCKVGGSNKVLWLACQERASPESSETYPESQVSYLAPPSPSGAINKALSKLQSRTIDLAVAFAERKKTASMLQDSITTLTEIIRNLRKRDVVTAMNQVSVLKRLRRKQSAEAAVETASMYLAVRYGWTPTVMDVYGACEAIENADNGTYERYIVRARARDSRSDNTRTVRTGSAGMPYTCVTTRARVGSVQVVLWAIPPAGIYTRLSDVGLTNPLLVGWELVPFSFVVDWFLSVGEFLEGVNVQFWTLRAGTVTNYKTVELHQQLSPRSTPYFQTASIAGGGFKSSKRWDRTVLTQMPTPSVVLKQNPLNLLHCTDAIMLLTSVMSGHVRKVVKDLGSSVNVVTT